MRPITCTISAAADGLSDAIDLQEQDIVGFIVPATWTAAAITFLAAPMAAGTFASCYDDANAEITVASTGIPTSGGRTVLFSDALQCKLRGVRHLKLRSGATGAAVQQGGARVFTIIAAND
jgi:hypothetical protein